MGSGGQDGENFLPCFIDSTSRDLNDGVLTMNKS